MKKLLSIILICALSVPTAEAVRTEPTPSARFMAFYIVSSTGIDGYAIQPYDPELRYGEVKIGRDYFTSDAEYESYLDGIPYLQFDGNISLMCAGAGLTTTVFDLINYSGGKVANYLEFGGANYKKAVRAMELCLKNSSAKVILIVTFGTIARADVMAEGIKSAIETLKPAIPIITCIRGTNEEAADETLRSCGLNPLYDTEEAVALAVKIAKES